MHCGYVHNFVNTLLYSYKELAVRIGKSHLNNIQINLKFFTISVLCYFIWWTKESCRWWWDTSYICTWRFSIWCKFQLVFSLLTLPLSELFHLWTCAFPYASWCSQQLCNRNYSNNYILSSRFHVYFIFKLVPFFPGSLPLSITGCSSLARASCVAQVRLDHTLLR